MLTRRRVTYVDSRHEPVEPIRLRELIDSLFYPWDELFLVTRSSLARRDHPISETLNVRS
jgi:hypothetical protein